MNRLERWYYKKEDLSRYSKGEKAGLQLSILISVYALTCTVLLVFAIIENATKGVDTFRVISEVSDEFVMCYVLYAILLFGLSWGIKYATKSRMLDREVQELKKKVNEQKG